MKAKLFWIFGILQNLTLSLIIFLLFRALNQINEQSVIGLDTQILLCITFPLFSLLTEYLIFIKK
jgi:hypothetical protein